MRRAGVLIRPRFAAGRDDVVAGYSVALRPVGDERPVWFGGGRPARDPTPPPLRERCPDSPQTAHGSVDEWRHRHSGVQGNRVSVSVELGGLVYTKKSTYEYALPLDHLHTSKKT